MGAAPLARHDRGGGCGHRGAVGTSLAAITSCGKILDSGLAAGKRAPHGGAKVHYRLDAPFSASGPTWRIRAFARGPPGASLRQRPLGLASHPFTGGSSRACAGASRAVLDGRADTPADGGFTLMSPTAMVALLSNGRSVGGGEPRREGGSRDSEAVSEMDSG